MPRFDPSTGAPLEPPRRFDPHTGERLRAPHTAFFPRKPGGGYIATLVISGMFFAFVGYTSPAPSTFDGLLGGPSSGECSSYWLPPSAIHTGDINGCHEGS